MRETKRNSRDKWLGAAAFMLLVYCNGAAAADPPPDPAKAATKPTTINSAISDVGDISTEMKKLEKHLASIEQSVAAINESLAPVGALTRPEGLTALISQVSDTAFSRSIALILLASGCAAVLLVLLAFLLRWSLRTAPIPSK